MRNAIKWASAREAEGFIDNVFYGAARIVSDGVHEYNNQTKLWECTLHPRQWFKQTRQRHQLHPAVHDLMLRYRPYDWQQLLLEWPHKSITDPNRLAYSRDERSAMHNDDCDAKAVITTIGKYLTRHFSGVPDNEIRDIVAKYTYGGSIELTTDIKRMVSVVMGGPKSCMTSRFDIDCEGGVTRHPYEVYDPSLGWGMYVRAEDDEVLGRCLVWHDPDDEETKGYVRSYKRERGEHSHSGADEAIETHLKNLGYAKWCGWPSEARIMKYETRRSGQQYLMPYIDGCNQRVEIDGHDNDTFYISYCGDIDASNTSGMAGGHEYTCDDCGDGFDDGDGYWTGIHEEHHVCEGCCHNNYTYAYSRRGNQYYIHSDDVVYINDEYYDVNYLSDNDIVELHDGEYEHTDNAVHVESEDEYYHVDDDDICYDDYNNRYELRDRCVRLADGTMCHEDDAWQCHESGDWYSDDEDYVEVDDKKYHPDNAPETETNDTETN